jgi:uncharacterized membrane protein
VVRAGETAIANAEVNAGDVHARTDATGVALLSVPPGTIDLSVNAEGFLPARLSVAVSAGAARDIVVTLERAPTIEEEVTVVASTRTNTRLEDQPMRVEVLAR